MTMPPEASRETATYWANRFRFLLPDDQFQFPRTELNRRDYHQVLTDTPLPGRLGEFLHHAFQGEAIYYCLLSGPNIELEATPNIPHTSQRTRPRQRIQIMWANLQTFYGEEDANDPSYWSSLPYIRQPRGEGYDLQEVGAYMNAFMYDICGATLTPSA